MKSSNRIFYIDNLRIFLISLVVLHHLAITYGASGGWFYIEVDGDGFTRMVMTMFVASNQSFSMGLFFLISAYFTRISLERKSIGTFVIDRVVRLGIPLVIFYFILSPLTIYMKVWLVDGADFSIIEFVKQYMGFGFGPMWFVETLILFSFFYMICKLIFRNKSIGAFRPRMFPKPVTIMIVALGISVVSFAVRIWFRLGSEIPHTGLQLPYFPQYITMLVLGILFAKHQWFDKITYMQGIKWFAFAQFFILAIFPLFFILGSNEGDPFAGGVTWESAILCIWEQIVGFSLMIGLIGIFKEKLNTQNKTASLLSGAAYAVFIVHPFILVTLSAILKDWGIYPVLKFIILTPVTLILCFSTGILIKKIPVVNRVI